MVGLVFPADLLQSASVAYIHYLSFMVCFGALIYERISLKANPNRDARGVIIESKLEKGRGSVATVLVQKGTLKVGDIFVSGSEWGKVKALREVKMFWGRS